jgi:cytochrome b involved in lipid metabolism
VKNTYLYYYSRYILGSYSTVIEHRETTSTQLGRTPFATMNHDSNDTQAVKLTGEEIAKHNSKDDCWVIIHGRGKSCTH